MNLEATIRGILSSNDGTASGFNRMNAQFERALAVDPTSYKLWTTYFTERCSQLRTISIDATAAESSLAKLSARMLVGCPFPGAFAATAREAASLGFFDFAVRAINRGLSMLPPTQTRLLWEAVLDIATSELCPHALASALLQFRAMKSRADKWWKGSLDWISVLFEKGCAAQAADATLTVADMFPTRLGNAAFVDLVKQQIEQQSGVSETTSRKLASLAASMTDQVANPSVRALFVVSVATCAASIGDLALARSVLRRELFATRTFDRFHFIWANWSTMELELAATQLVPVSDCEKVCYGEERLWAELRFTLKPSARSAISWADAAEKEGLPSEDVDRIFKVTIQKLLSEGTAAEYRFATPVFTHFARWLCSKERVAPALNLLRTTIVRAKKSGVDGLEALADCSCAVSLERGIAISPDVLAAASPTVQAEVAASSPEEGHLWETLWSLRGKLSERDVVHWSTYVAQRGQHPNSRRLLCSAMLRGCVPAATVLSLVPKIDASPQLSSEVMRSLYERACQESPEALPDFARFEEAHGCIRGALDALQRYVDADPEQVARFGSLVHATLRLEGADALRALAASAAKGATADIIVRRSILIVEGLQTLGERASARTVFKQASMLVDPRSDPHGFWQMWKNFEVEFGSQETFEDMTRAERSVAEKYSGVEVQLDTSGPKAFTRRTR